VINKLISTLGSTSEDDPARNGSMFGERDIKDVTGTVGTTSEARVSSPLRKIDSGAFIAKGHEEKVLQGLDKMSHHLPSFDPFKFLSSAKSVFEILISDAGHNESNLQELVDKRYLEIFSESVDRYGKLQNLDALDAKIIEVYMFGNSAFIKLLLTGERVTESIPKLSEEWTFTRNLNASGKIWHLSNIVPVIN
jgi:predicted lipid-binding transport protein (Tim44 family)